MLCEKTFKSVGGKQSEKNCGDLCPHEKSELKSTAKTMLSNNYKSNIVRQHRSKDQTSTRQIIKNNSLNMKQKSIQLVFISCFFTTLLMRKYLKHSLFALSLYCVERYFDLTSVFIHITKRKT